MCRCCSEEERRGWVPSLAIEFSKEAAACLRSEVRSYFHPCAVCTTGLVLDGAPARQKLLTSAA